MNVAPKPVSAAEADALFAPLARYGALLLAVSGGVDSMALLELIADWRQRRAIGAPAVFVATVDHQLRAGSRAEAEFVATRCAALGIEHAILTWSDAKPASGVANAARDARYRLLHDHALRVAANAKCAIFTAHTEDDQAETFAMRLARGSGVDGLAAMAAERPMQAGSPVMLARPLLDVAKSRLVATLTARARDWREDPSNQSQASERVRVRNALVGLAEAGVNANALATTARRMGEARAALEYGDAAFEITLSLDFNNEIFVSLDRAVFAAAPALLRQRLLQRVIRRFGGDTPAPTLCEIEDLAARLAHKPQTRATLGGAVVASSSRTLKLWREAGRITAPAIVLAANATALWDNRFWLSREGRPDIDVTVRPLGADGVRCLAPGWSGSLRPPSAALEALPGFWAADRLIAAPSLPSFAAAMQPPAFEGLQLKAVAAAFSGANS